MTIKVTQDGQIWQHNFNIGYVDDDKVFLIERGQAVQIGTVDHRSQVVAVVDEYRRLRSSVAN